MTNDACRVLLVRNDEEIAKETQKRLHSCLGPAGYYFVPSTSYEELAEELAENPIELVVFAEGGAEAVRQKATEIAQRHPEVQIFLVTRFPPLFGRLVASLPHGQFFCDGVPREPAWQHFALFMKRVHEVLEADAPKTRFFQLTAHFMNFDGVVSLAEEVVRSNREKRPLGIFSDNDDQAFLYYKGSGRGPAEPLATVESLGGYGEDDLEVFVVKENDADMRPINLALDELCREGLLAEMELKLVH